MTHETFSIRPWLRELPLVRMGTFSTRCQCFCNRALTVWLDEIQLEWLLRTRSVPATDNIFTLKTLQFCYNNYKYIHKLQEVMALSSTKLRNLCGWDAWLRQHDTNFAFSTTIRKSARRRNDQAEFITTGLSGSLWSEIIKEYYDV